MTNEQLIRGAIDAYARGDLDAAMSLCDADVRYCIQADGDLGPYAVDVRGRAGFAEALVAIVADFEVERFELADLIVQGDRAASRQDVVLRNRATGRRIAAQNALFWRISGGSIAGVLEFHDTALLAAGRAG